MSTHTLALLRLNLALVRSLGRISSSPLRASLLRSWAGSASLLSSACREDGNRGP